MTARRWKLKVCGMRETSNIAHLQLLSPDYMGFIFYEKSKRYAGDTLEPSALSALNKSIERVGVFVNASNEEIAERITSFHLDLVQLHGDETPEQCRALKQQGISVIKAFAVDGSFDFGMTAPYEAVCDYFLFDTKGEGYGGTGKTFDWEVLKQYNNKVPFFLSGGVDVDSVSKIRELQGLNIHAIDINSRFETEPGIKNIDKIRQFIKLLEL